MDQLLATFLNPRPTLRSEIVSTLASDKNWTKVATKISIYPAFSGRITLTWMQKIECGCPYDYTVQAERAINELSNLGMSVRQFIQGLRDTQLETTAIAFEKEVLASASAVSTSNSAASAGVTVNFIGQAPQPTAMMGVAPSMANAALAPSSATVASDPYYDPRYDRTARIGRRNRLVPAKELFEKGYHAVIQVPHINPAKMSDPRIEFSNCLVVFVRDPENLDAENAAAEEADVLMHEDVTDSGGDETKITQGYIRAEPYDYHGPEGEKVKSRSQQAQSRSARRAQASK